MQVDASLREGWIVERETLNTYESPRQIQMRFAMADFSLYPEVEKLRTRMAAGEDVGADVLASVPQDVQQEVFFMIGARGVHDLLHMLLHAMNSDEDVEALSVLSTVRHKLLSLNASAIHH